MIGTQPHVGHEIEDTMLAMVLRRTGGSSVFTAERRPLPVPKPGEFRVRVLACGVCGHDVLSRSGGIPSAENAVLGHEIAGIVDTVGSEDLAPWLAQRVALVQRRPCGICDECLAGATNQCRNGPGFYGDDIPGGYSEYVLADPLNAVVVPDSIDDPTAAILSCGVGTGLRAINASGCSPGDVLLITGAGGGVGLNAVGVAAARDMVVIAATTSTEKVDALFAAGATEVLVKPKASEVKAAASRHGRRRGVDAVLELTGAPTFAMSLRSLAPSGRVVVVGNVDPKPFPFEGGLTIVRELEVKGSAHATRSDLEEVISMVTSGLFVPPPTEVHPLSDIVLVHAALDARAVVGRAVVVP